MYVPMYVVWREKYVTRITYYNIITFNDAHKDPGDRLSYYDTNREVNALLFCPDDHLSSTGSRVSDSLGDYLLDMTTTCMIYNIYIMYM